MTRYVLREDISFCRIGERLVFLDIGSDRYFHLPRLLEQALTTFLDGADGLEQPLTELVERSILVERASAAAGYRPNIEPAVRSAMEAPAPPHNLRASELMEVLATVLATRAALKFSRLKTILHGLTAARHARAPRSSPCVERSVSDASAAFRHARQYVPIDMRCLLDSIAMARFLIRRCIPAHVVFGVALDPFSAHCWVQVDDLVLNDSVGNVVAHMPIRVV